MTSLMPRANRAPMHPVKSYARTHQVLEPSSLVNIQTESFDALKTQGIREVLDEINPVQDVTGNRFELRFGAHSFREPRYSEEECRTREVTFEAPLYVTVELEVKGDRRGQGADALLRGHPDDDLHRHVRHQRR